MTRPPLARIRSIATAVAPHRLPQTEVREFAHRFFGVDLASQPRLMQVFENAAIDERQMARPVSWYEQPRSFPDKNAVYVEQALDMSQRAATEALTRAEIPLARLGGVVFVSSTGLATPSLDATLVQTLGLPRDIARVPLWGLGCAGGAAGLARASALCRGLDRPVLLLCAEVCSVTFVHGDRRPANVVATALFGDGAAAAVLSPDGEGPAVIGGFSHLLDDTEDVMGWTLRDAGLEVRFASRIPELVLESLPRMLDGALASHGLGRDDIEHFIMHPGGAKVLAAYERALDLAPDALAHSRAVLRAHGNMSGPTLLYVLKRWRAETEPSGGYSVAMSLGPGFCGEGIVLRW